MPLSPVVDAEQIFAAWRQFTAGQGMDVCVPPVIAASWRRCWAHINPIQELQFTRLSEDHLLSSQVNQFNLISLARPVMEDIYQCIEKTDIVIMLVNAAGCVLDLMGDQAQLEKLAHWGGLAGAILTEEQIGTNSIGLALAERMPVQVTGAEHYVLRLHEVAGAAAPIFDPTGNLLGALAIIMPVEKSHPYALGLVLAGVRAIEGLHQADVLLAEQNNHLAQLNTILSSISDGILVWNGQHVLLHANRAACQMVGLPAHYLVGKRLDALPELPETVRTAIRRCTPISDVEVTLTVNARQSNYLVSVDCVHTQNRRDEIAWIIATLRPEEKVRNLVQQQMGARAMLTLEDIPGDSPHICRVRNMVDSVANAQASVLIRGEEGVGKNVLANAIHNAGLRRDGPFVIFAPASIPNELVISELLGFDESAGGRSRGSRPSKFELAQGGTLFFQGVDALPLEAQTVLLNALELGSVQRLGGQRMIEVDARIIASSAANIEALIVQGSFRADLYYRLSAFLIDIPPLRERSRDIPFIVERVLNRLSAQLGISLKLGHGVMDLLKRSPWYGNVREIESVLTRAAMQVKSDGVIEMQRLLVNTHSPELKNASSGDRLQSMREMERSAILLAAQACGGNVTLMAQVLGISRTTLWRRIKGLGLDIKDSQNCVSKRNTRPRKSVST